MNYSEDLVHIIETIPFNKLSDYVFSVGEVIALQSRLFYANADENLGYYTLAQNEQNYRTKISELLEGLIALVNENRLFSILELGGGTGKFASNLIKNLTEKNIRIDYTIVDVSTRQYPESLRNNTSVHFIEESFTNFASNNKKDFDFLIMQESLDMWAGEEKIEDEWTSTLLPFNVYWILIDLDKKNVHKKKDIKNLHNDEKVMNIWVQIFVNKEEKRIITKLEENYKNRIQIPESLTNLLQRVKLLTVIQDYWSFSDEDNMLRMGLYEESIEKTLDKFFPLSKELRQQLETNWSKELEKTKGMNTWITSQIIPFGIVDVTYSPDQSQILELALENGLEIVNYNAQNIHQYNHEIYEVGEKENEIFVLFTDYAIKLQFKQNN